jgi:hypothetical protein
MKTQLFIYDVDASTELTMKVQPLYCGSQENNILAISDKEYTPTKGDKLYFLPGVNIPRVKLKDLYLQHGIKTVRDIDQATHVFCGKNTINKITNNHWYYYMPTETLRAILNDPETIMDDYYRENLDQALEFYTEPDVVVAYSSASELRNAGVSFVERHINGNILRHSNTYYTVDDEYKDLFPKILSIELFDESELLKHINGEDAATIDETMFLQISDMFKSSDKDNHIIAMEIMANSNYMESLLYIEMLFKEFYNIMSDCNTRNHVNFKSLISFLDKNKNYMRTDIDDIVKSLLDKNKLSIEKVDVIMKYYADEIAMNGGTRYFEIRSLTLNNDIAKLLNTDYAYQTFPDYLPENTSEVSEIYTDLADLNSLDTNTSEITDEVETIEEVLEEIFIQTDERLDELKSELIESEEDFSVSELELNKEDQLKTQSNNNQIEEKNGDDFEWF